MNASPLTQTPTSSPIVLAAVTPIGIATRNGALAVEGFAVVAPIGSNVVVAGSVECFLPQVQAFPLTANATRVPVATESSEAKPFLQWVGGKREMIARYPELLPQTSAGSTYFEPFLGGGAMMFHLKGEVGAAVVNDSNTELIKSYVGIRDDVETVIGLLTALKARHSSELYFHVRALDRVAGYVNWSPAEVAARMIYLNQTCYNGLYRVNRAGQLNTSIGASLNRAICDAVSLRTAAKFLKGVTLTNQDFVKACAGIKAGDFLFLDPPYVSLGGSSDFGRYTKDPFTFADQVRVRDLMVEASSKGAFVLATNNDTPAVRELYAGFHLTAIDSSRKLSSAKAQRGDVAELAITNYPINALRVAA